jgi:hypothetical protein
MYDNFKKQYRNLETSVLHELRCKVEKSETKSSFIADNVLSIDYDGFVELGIINDKLVFISDSGYHYDILTASLEDLIDILINSK